MSVVLVSVAAAAAFLVHTIEMIIGKITKTIVAMDMIIVIQPIIIP